MISIFMHVYVRYNILNMENRNAKMIVCTLQVFIFCGLDRQYPLFIVCCTSSLVYQLKAYVAAMTSKIPQFR